jgi:hypothetical protein
VVRSGLAVNVDGMCRILLAIYIPPTEGRSGAGHPDWTGSSIMCTRSTWSDRKVRIKLNDDHFVPEKLLPANTDRYISSDKEGTS